MKAYVAWMDELEPNRVVSGEVSLYRYRNRLWDGKFMVKTLDKPIHEDGNIYVYSWNRSIAENTLVKEFFRCQK